MIQVIDAGLNVLDSFEDEERARHFYRNSPEAVGFISPKIMPIPRKKTDEGD